MDLTTVIIVMLLTINDFFIDCHVQPPHKKEIILYINYMYSPLMMCCDTKQYN